MAQTQPTVVLVDDNPSVGSLFELSVAVLDVDLKSYHSAAQSMAYLQDNRPDLLFLDIIMPDKDGLTFLQELRRDPLHRDTPVVIISSKDYAQDRSAARELGAVDFLAKPMRAQAIQELIIKHTRARLKDTVKPANE